MFSSNLQGEMGERKNKGSQEMKVFPKRSGNDRPSIAGFDTSSAPETRPRVTKGRRRSMCILCICASPVRPLRLVREQGRAGAGGARPPVHIVPHPCNPFTWCGSRAGQGQATRDQPPRDLDVAVGPGNA
jgi:hypothetical protein